MKKLLAIMLAAVMVLAMFAGCGNTAAPADPADPSAPAEPAELDLVGFCTVSMSESIYVQRGSSDQHFRRQGKGPDRQLRSGLCTPDPADQELHHHGR